MAYALRIRGQVVVSFTGDGIGGVRVEAWDKDFGLDDYLRSATTISDGSFSIVFDGRRFTTSSSTAGQTFTSKSIATTSSWPRPKIGALERKSPQVGVTIRARHPEPPECDERHIYLKIERIEGYSPVQPQDNWYRRSSMAATACEAMATKTN